MKNRICLILPYVGKFHNYFELFLHSIYRNKDILDLLILIPDSSTPELKTEITFKIPENVFIKEVSFIEASQIFEDKLSDLFDTKIELLNNDKFSIVKKPYNLCHYRGLYNLWAKDFLKDYSHWGWTDCDLILGNILEFYPNALELGCVTGLGHFNYFLNQELPDSAFGKGPAAWEWVAKHFNAARDVFCEQPNAKFIVPSGADEGWMIRTFRAYYQQSSNFLVGSDAGSRHISITPGMSLQVFEYKATTPENKCEIQLLEKFVYNDGTVAGVFKNKEVKFFMYVHLMRRTHLCNKVIEVNDYAQALKVEIFPPLEFVSIA